MPETIVQELLKLPLFAGVSPGDCEAVAGYFALESVPRGAVLLREGQSSGRVYILLDSAARVYTWRADGKATLINIAWKRAFVGELDAVRRGPYSANLETCDFGRVLRIAAADFVRCLELYPQVRLNYELALCEREVARIELATQKDGQGVRGRLAAVIAHLARQSGDLVGGKVPPNYVIPATLLHYDLFSLANISESAGDREIGYFKRENLIQCPSHGKLIIVDRAALAALRD